MDSKIRFVIIGVCVAAIIIILVNQSLSKTTQTESENQYITKGNITTNSNDTELAQNYTSIQLLTYCTSNEYQVYNDVCVRGLWDVSDQCKNENFSSTNPVCNDPRFVQFENKVDKVMQDLDKSLTQFVNSCVGITPDNDTASCSMNIERIQNDCSDPRFYGMMTICKNSNFITLLENYSSSP